ncbi:ABC transporter permease [Streptomyces sp. NBC_01187]|uniref:ABC transporter permease n=1 Tax=unclassified Streptomyces TaxID=2593676 RepID=UPI003866C75A
MACCVALTVVLGVISGIVTDGRRSNTSDPVEVSLFGLNFVQLIIPVMGVLLTAGEHSTGVIRATTAAVPRRLPVLWAKTAVFGAVVFVAVLAMAFTVFPLAQVFLSDTPLAASISDPGVVRALFGSAASVALIGVLGLALGALLRSIAAGIGAFVVVLTVLPQLAGALPYDWVKTAVSYTPLPAGQGLMAVVPQPDFPGPLAGLLALCAWALVTAAITALGIGSVPGASTWPRCWSGRPGWRSSGTSGHCSRRRPSAHGSRGRCTTSWPTTSR